MNVIFQSDAAGNYLKHWSDAIITDDGTRFVKNRIGPLDEAPSLEFIRAAQKFRAVKIKNKAVYGTYET